MERQSSEGRLALADGAQIGWTRYHGSGQGRILLIHALAMDRSNWDQVIEALPEGYEVIAVDCRGHGASEEGSLSFSIAQFAADLVAVMEAEGWESAVVAGCSMGGCVAQALAAQAPERVAGLVLIDTTSWYGEEAEANWSARADKAASEGLASLLPFQRERWFSDAFRAAHPDLVARAEAVFLANDLAPYRKTCAMLGVVDLRGALKGFKAPCAVIVGEEDYATPIAAARALVEEIPQAKLSILERARHFTPIERPHEIAARLVEIATAARSRSA